MPTADKTAETRYHHGDLRHSLIDAAQLMITESGVENFSLRKAALAVGVSQAALYRHFSGKEELLAAVAKVAFLNVSKRLQKAYEHAQEEVIRERVNRETEDHTNGEKDLARSVVQAKQTLKAVGLAYVVFASEHPNLYRLMFDASLSNKQRYPELTDARRQALKWAAKAVTSIFEQQQPFVDGHLENTKFLLQSSIHGVASFVIEGLAPNYKSLAEMINALVDQTLITDTSRRDAH